MNIIDLYHEINIKNTDWDMYVSSTINEDDTITITVPNCHYQFELIQDTQNPDIIYGGIYTNDESHEVIENDYCYDAEGETVEAVAEAIMSDIQTDMVEG